VRGRRHAADGRALGRASVLLVLAGILMLMLAGAAYAGYRYEQARATRMLPGVRIAGVDVGGMTLEEAERALIPAVTRILERPIEVKGGGREWVLTAQGLGTRVDVRAAVDEALSQSSRYHWSARLYRRLLDRPIDRDIGLPIAHDDSYVERFVEDAAAAIERAPRDAYLDFADGKLIQRSSRPGRRLRERASTRSLMDAVRSDATSMKLQVRPVEPSVSEKTLGQTIIIRLSQNRLYLYDGLELLKNYPVATGQPAYPTPQGHWMIVNKRINPTWYNPAKDTWGKNEPDFIPPGPDNPLGTRALDLDASGIRIHGTYADSSIGTYASHGCIRMHIYDSEDLFGLVEVGTPVIIAY
jgi:lipoprotein-anchoring transpeptidase ErfK/SrfK